MVITRFAPSPTGYLHVGGARTALFCRLMASHNSGQMILRIEDTDQKRNTPTAMKQVIKDLKWLGINWDQGPEVGGPKGPYLQSQRREHYDKYINQLLEQGKAYYCFDTAEELTAMRDKASKQKQNFLYPRPEKFPTQADVENAKEQGKLVSIRFCMPAEEILIEDTIRGQVRFAPGEFSDFIICKSDGFPTYHFACVVDDELMGVTNVIRGQEHLMNTPLHQALQDALGFRRPVYTHMAVTVSEGGGKLSKRDRSKVLRNEIKALENPDLSELASVGNLNEKQMADFLKKKSTPDDPAVEAMANHLGIKLPEVNVIDFRRSGYLPQAVINFLALLGWNPGDEREIMDFDELVEAFDVSRLAKTNSLFDRNKLIAFNTEHIKRLDEDKLLGYFKDFLNLNSSPLAGFDDPTLSRLIKISHGARTLADIEAKGMFLAVTDDNVPYDEKAVKKILLKNENAGIAMLTEIRGKLQNLTTVDEQTLETLLRGLAEEKGVGLGKVAQPIRVAICGGTVSGPIFDTIDMLGMERTIKRIDKAIEKFGK